jgi:dCMP deaminase
MNSRMTNFYMDIAKQCSTMSRARRLKVGSVIVKNNNIISFSWNGMPAGWDNDCEYKEYPDKWSGRHEYMDLDYPLQEPDGTYYRLKTRPEVLHAERNALDKLAKGSAGGEGATIFVTHAPCMECAKSIYGAGITSVFYNEDYRDDTGVKFLKQCGIDVTKVD